MKDTNVEIVKSVLDRIKTTSSKNDKIDILKEFEDNQIIRDTLRFLFNEFIVTGLAIKKIEKEVGVTPGGDINNLAEAFDYLKYNNTGSDVNIAEIQYFIEQQDEENQTFLKQIFTKTYRCGITAKTVNMAFPKDIPEFACQLANSYAKHADKVKSVFTLSTKLDGHRSIVTVDSLGNAKFFTRKGNPVDGLTEISEDIRHIANENGILGTKIYNKGFVFDGEITLSEVKDKSKTFQETSKVIRKDGEKTGLKLNIFDLVPLDEFFAGESSLTYQQRRADMDRTVGRETRNNVSLLGSLYTGTDLSQIVTVLDDALSNDEEGIMINLDTTYKTKRNSGILKVKEFTSDDLLVTGIYEGSKGSKYEGMLGGVYVDYKGTQVGVGSGFSDEERLEYFENPDLIVGKIIEVQYFGETENQKNEDKSMRFPVFRMIRDDKDEDDVSYED